MQPGNIRDDELSEDDEAPIFVKGRLPRSLHHQMKILLATNQETWEGWIQRKAHEDLAPVRLRRPDQLPRPERRSG